MKANEAPDKIYVHVKDGKVCNTWNSEWIGVNDIEYTRTDAFIEKACEWLKEQDEMVGVSFEEDFIERFKNYIKGE